MDRINLIIPCAGSGQRFIDAGYESYKALIHVFGKPMINHVIDAFPTNTRIFIITDHDHKPLLENIVRNYKYVEVIGIDAHKQGAAWSLVKAGDFLPLDQACFLAYNDVMWTWNFADVQNFIDVNQADGIVFTQTGFHPHLYKNNFSAFCLLKENKLLAIKEKGCFTNNWMNEPLSTGVYYFSNIAKMLANAKKMIENDIRTAGEFYPSEIFNLMINDGLCVKNYETTKFLHAGIPEQLEDAEEWKHICNVSNKQNNVPSLIMMCGTGTRMKAVSPINKADLIIGESQMFRFVTKKNASTNNTFLVNNETISLLDKEDKRINIGGQTQSQAESLLRSLEHFHETKNLLVLSNDCYGIFDTSLLKDFEDYQMVLFGFGLRLIHRKQENAHTGFSYIGKNVSDVHIKSVFAGDLGLAGMYYFPDISVIKQMQKYDYFKNGSVDDLAKYLISEKQKVGFVKLDYYVHLGTPEEYNEFLFWKKFFYE